MTTSADPLVEALNHLRLYGCLARIDEIRGEPWLERVMTIEREERTRRSLVHRTHLAGVGAFKPLCDFDWAWPKGIDRAQVEDLFSLRFIAEGENVILVGPNGVGKTMILRNLAHRALHDGRAVVVRTASDLLADLAKQESSVARARRLEAYVRPQLLCIDEVALSANVRETDARPKFSVEGEQSSSREFINQLSPCPTPPDGSDGEGQATEVHRRVQEADPQGGRRVRSRRAWCSPPS